MLRHFYFIGGIFFFWNLCRIVFGEHTYCHRRLQITAGRGVSAKSYLSTLNYTGVPCTYFDGNLILSTRLGDDGLTNKTLVDLLNQIRVITGFIYIALEDENTTRIQFNSLEIIYGRELVPYKGTNYSVFIAPLRSETAAMDFITIEMPNLRAIENGNVGFLRDDVNLCNYPNQLAWHEIFFNPKTQKVYTVPSCKEENRIHIECSNSCLPIDGSPRCWGPQEDQCQLRTRCRKRIWRYCYRDANGEEELCSDECIGGCYGSGEDKCFGCSQYELNGKCVASCPRGMFILDHLCVDQCPDKMAVDNNACVNQCPPGFVMKDESRFCEPCSPSGCHHKVCRLLNDADDFHLDLTKERLASLINCTILQGSLVLTTRAFQSLQNKPVITSIEEFDALENLEVVTGIVSFDFGNRVQAKSLHFLRRLREIQGRYRGNFNKKQSFMVSQIRIEHLGLQSLESVAGGNVLFYKTLNLAYAYTVNWTKLGVVEPLLTVPNISNMSGKCDPKCDPEWGCVGPGPTMCLRCLEWRSTDHLCVSNCSLAPRHYTPTSKERSVQFIAKKICARCHPECAESCVGPQTSQCVGSCLNKRYDDTCIPNCPHFTFTEGNAKTCQRCSTDCHNRTITQKPVCRGPSSSDCNKCNVLVYDNQKKTTCRPISQHCPPSSYSIVVTDQKSPAEVISFIEEGDVMEVCYPCTPPCTQCTSNTECQYCSGVWFGDKCVKECPSELIPLKYRHNSTAVNQTCFTCDKNCKGGCIDIGPTDCYACRFFSMEIKVGNSTALQCVSLCPEKTIPNDHGRCIPEAETIKGKLKRTLTIIFSVMIPIVFFVAILVLICAYLGWKRRNQYREEKQRIQDIYTNTFDNMDSMNSTMENRPINLSRLEFIQSDELNMDTSKLLGSGAFGEVFKAEWSISEDKLQKRVVEYGGNSPLLSTIGSTFFRTSTLRSATQQRLRQIEVAVKRVSALKTGAGADTRDEVFAEAQVMASVKHPNCLPLIGICMSEGYLITAYMPKGSLDRYLSNNHQYLDPDVMFLWCQQIADGMNYLTDQGIIHRDLAARNVLLKDRDWAMITDFGLSKMLESESQREVVIVAGRVPIRWLAVETLRHGIYSAATDVWAYGITIWEIFSFAEMPYKEMETLAVRDHVLQGGRLNQPNGLSDQVFLEMYKCWAEDSDSRPTFNLLKMKFKAFGQCAQNHFVIPSPISEVETNSSILRETNRSRRNANRSLKKTSNDKLSAYPPSSFASSAGYTDMSQALSVAFDKSKATRYENIPEEHELQLQRPLLKGSEKEDALSSEASPFSDTSESAYSPTPLYSNGNQYC